MRELNSMARWMKRILLAYCLAYVIVYVIRPPNKRTSTLVLRRAFSQIKLPRSLVCKE